MEINLKDFYFSAQNNILRYSDGYISLSICLWMEIHLHLFGQFVSTAMNVCPFKACDLVYTHTFYASGFIEVKLSVPKRS